MVKGRERERDALGIALKYKRNLFIVLWGGGPSRILQGQEEVIFTLKSPLSIRRGKRKGGGGMHTVRERLRFCSTRRGGGSEPDAVRVDEGYTRE